jgi:hypothetical protein
MAQFAEQGDLVATNLETGGFTAESSEIRRLSSIAADDSRSTADRIEAFSPCIFTTYFDAVNYFPFSLTGVGGGDLRKQL